MTNVVRANRTIEDRARFGLGSETQDDDSDPSTTEKALTAEGVIEDTTVDVTTAPIATHAALTQTTGLHGLPKVTVVDGTAAAANVTLAAIAAADTLVSVLAFTTKASIATLADRTSEYAPGAGVLTKAAGTDETNNQLVVFWIDKA